MLLAHSGQPHQQETVYPVKNPSPPVEEAADNIPAVDNNSQLNTESNLLPKKTIEATPKKTQTETINPESLTIPEKSASATLKPGLGESIFVLLIVSPFLLSGFKRWLNK